MYRTYWIAFWYAFSSRLEEQVVFQPSRRVLPGPVRLPACVGIFVGMEKTRGLPEVGTAEEG